ncbi:hypothetical protein RN001_002979 [Aquatica leii]|uniref:HAT C-terminal dimerisation domain-containing protein n=1 Tax=Aquatica leii TaxID=1421715 RepID=A0AAN7SRF6_9COLE|nr:hypothetical protein RN001_002979 [Aquatica leii]
MEAQNISVLKVGRMYEELVFKLEKRLQHCFMPLEVRQNLKKLEEEGALLRKYVTEGKIQAWNEASTPEHVSCDNLLKIVEFSLCLPGTNAPVERVFSLMNKVWTSEKTQLSVTTLKSILVTKYNFNESCSEFYHLIKENEAILSAVHSSSQYKNSKN